MHKERESLDDQQKAEIKAKPQLPILMGTEMVKAILNETKIQTRRIVKARPRECEDPNKVAYDEWFSSGAVFSPYGKVGDVLWVRETYKFLGMSEDDDVVIQFKDGAKHTFQPELDREDYWTERLEKLLDVMAKKDKVIVDEENERYTWKDKDVPFKPTIHMTKDAARIWLQIIDMRVERLHDISEEDSIAEGILFFKSDITKSTHYKDYMADSSGYGKSDHDYPTVNNPIDSFRSLWDSINGADSWKDNPWVWVVSFKKIENPNV